MTLKVSATNTKFNLTELKKQLSVASKRAEEIERDLALKAAS